MASFRYLFLACVLSLTMTTTTAANILTDLAVTVEQTVVSTASTQCALLKSLLGVSYAEIDKKNETALLNNLTLDFITYNTTIVYNLSTAAYDIPNAKFYDPTQKLYIFLHGYTDNPTKQDYRNISSALFSQGNCNVLALDASSLISHLYLRSTTYIHFIGEKLAEVLAAMVTISGVLASDIHLFGHSLGGHTAGFTGKRFYNSTGSLIGRITGLDPAGPCFINLTDDLRLASTDAAFVDVIHTNAGVEGLDEVLGHVDYWPNGGETQPGCGANYSCSHNRAVFVCAESIIKPTAFPAVKCDSWSAFKKGSCNTSDTSYMGMGSTNASSGSYFLQTMASVPFALGDSGMTYNKTLDV